MRPGQEAPDGANRLTKTRTGGKRFNEAGARSPGWRPSVQTPDTKRKLSPVCERVGFLRDPGSPLTTDEAWSTLQSLRKISRLEQFERPLGISSCLTSRLA